MSVLVLNARDIVADGHLAQHVTSSIKEIVRQARFAERPIAHIHPAADGGATVLPIPIGRYDPVFRSNATDDAVPNGLIEFILRSPSAVIDVVGAGRVQHFDRLTDLMQRAGYQPRLYQPAIFTLHGSDESHGD